MSQRLRRLTDGTESASDKERTGIRLHELQCWRNNAGIVSYRIVSWCVSSISSASIGKGLELLHTCQRRMSTARGLSEKCCSHVVRLEGVVIVNLYFLLEVLLVRRAGASVVAAPELGNTLDPFGLVCGGGGRHGSSACTNTGGGGSSEREAGTGRGGP